MENGSCQTPIYEPLPNSSSSNTITSYVCSTPATLDEACSADLFVACAIFIGLLAHNLIFRYGEWDGIADKVYWIHCALVVAAFSTLYERTPKPRGSIIANPALAQTGYGLLAYAGALFVSIAVYRSVFHRLRRFPGPTLARISNWYSAFNSVRRWRIHEKVHKLHQQHGDFVRVGPTELSVTDPDAIQEIYGIQSTCVRGPIASLSPDRYLYPFDRDREMHHSQRRIWSKAFNAKEVLLYVDIVAKHTASLRDYLDSRLGRVVDMSEVLRLSSFDIMVEIFYGKVAGTLHSGKESKAQTAVHHLKLELAVVKYMPWIVSLGKIWPFRAGGYTQVCKYSDKFVNQVLQAKTVSDGEGEQKARQQGHQVRAVNHFLEQLRDHKDVKKADRLLRGDSDLFMIAGWDNQANMMATALFHLVQYPEILALVREEVDVKHAASYGIVQDSVLLQEQLSERGHRHDKAHARWVKSLDSSPHLTSVIWEVMRIYPSLAQGVQRMTPPQGLEIGDVSIPGDVIISMPHYTLFRDPRSFVDPDAFRPERWTSRPELVKDGKVFRPFGTGLSPCPGRHLAIKMLKYVLAELVLNYDMQLAPTTTAKKVLDGRYEAFNMVFGTVELVLQPRVRS